MNKPKASEAEDVTAPQGSGGVRVFTFDLDEPDDRTAALVDEQILRAHRYRNALTEIERERRAAIRRALDAHPDVDALAAGVRRLEEHREPLRAKLAAARAAARRRSVAFEGLAELKQLDETLRQQHRLLRDARTALRQDPAVVAALEAAETRSRERVREARAQCGTYWGTYLLVEAAADMARKGAPTLAPNHDPSFRRWNHGETSLRVVSEDGASSIEIRDQGDEGRVSAQLQGGLALDDLWGGSLYVQIDPVPAAAHDPTTRRGERRRLCRTKLRLRLGSDQRAPIWGEWSFVLHRPIPQGSRLKVATVARRRRDCRRWAWTLHLQVELPPGWASSSAGAGTGACALNLGWCVHREGLRVGYVVGDDGLEREIVLPRSIIDRVESAEAIRAHRDDHLNTMRAALAEHLRTLPDLPEWIRGRTRHLDKWRSPMAFRRLAYAWRIARFPGDEIAYEAVEAWRYRDEHLQRYESGLVRSAAIHRREIYRRVAAGLSRRYRIIVIDDTDLAALQHGPEETSSEGDIPAVKRNQRHAASSILRATMVSAFGRAGEIDRESSVDVTARCNECGSIERWDRMAEGRLHTCSACGTTWDQDANACQNLLRARRERLAAVNASPTARNKDVRKIKPSRSDRLRAARKRGTETSVARE